MFYNLILFQLCNSNASLDIVGYLLQKKQVSSDTFLSVLSCTAIALSGALKLYASGYENRNFVGSVDSRLVKSISKEKKQSYNDLRSTYSRDAPWIDLKYR